mmetsp:Transcript_25524/g.62007  ORF Transcript_25524/g.62007 Transcript_25524/m.62007 type:complete len:214 (-) Transcript_25524:446-1087(-)
MVAQARRAGEGLWRRSVSLRPLIQSLQSSRVLRCATSQALRNSATFTFPASSASPPPPVSSAAKLRTLWPPPHTAEPPIALAARRSYSLSTTLAFSIASLTEGIKHTYREPRSLDSCLSAYMIRSFSLLVALPTPSNLHMHCTIDPACLDISTPPAPAEPQVLPIHFSALIRASVGADRSSTSLKTAARTSWRLGCRSASINPMISSTFATDP